MITEEIQAFSDAIEKRHDRATMRRDRAIFRVIYHHGLRIHEVGRLRLVDFRDRVGLLYIYIQR